MKKKRARKAPKVKGPSENEIHMKAAKWLRDEHPSLLAFHVANELKAHVSYHLKQKRLGKLNGVADWLVFPNSGAKLAIELKDDEGEQDEDQIKFEKRWVRSGGSYWVVRTLQEFKNIIEAVAIFN